MWSIVDGGREAVEAPAGGYRAGDEIKTLDLRKAGRDEDLRSASAFLACVVGAFPGNACWYWRLGNGMSWGKKVGRKICVIYWRWGQMVLCRWQGCGLLQVVCYDSSDKNRGLK